MKKALKSIYKALPFKHTLFSLVRKIGVPSHSIYKHLHFKGVFQVKVSPKESFKIMHHGYEIENELFWKGFNGGWEKVSLALWIQLCRKAEVIFDIGANTGIYSLAAKAVNNPATVVAFEPVERVYNKLVQNVRLNGYDVVCIKKAASNYTGKAMIFDTTSEHVLSVTVNKNLNSPGVQTREYEIETTTLEEVIGNLKLEKVNLLKIDVETHEPEVLEGLGVYLKKFRPAMFVEVLNDEVGGKINQLLEGLDYLYFNIDENTGVRQVDKIGRSDYYNFLVCSKEEAIELKLI